MEGRPRASPLASDGDQPRSHYSVIDCRSTSSSRESDRSAARVEHRADFHTNVVKYVDFESPILKHLIDIEQKFWNSRTNQTFKFPRQKDDDSEASIASLAGITAYELTSQNQKRPLSARIQAVQMGWNAPDSHTMNSEARSCDARTMRLPNKDSSGDIDAKKYRSSNAAENGPPKKSFGKLEHKLATKLKIRQLCHEALGKDILIGSKTPVVKRKLEKAQKLFLKKSNIHSKGNSPPRVHTSGREAIRKSGTKENSRRGFSRRVDGVATRLDITDKGKYSYLKLESSEMNPKKAFLKKFNNLLKKNPGNTHLKDLKERSNRKLEEDRRKSQADLLSNSKMFSKLINLPTTSSKQERPKVSSRELLTKISSDILAKQTNVLHKYRMDFDTRGSASKSQQFSLNPLNSNLLKTPKETKTSALSSFKTKQQILTLTQTRTSSKKRSLSKKKSQKDSSLSKTSKRKPPSPGFKTNRMQMQTLGNLDTHNAKQRSGDKSKVEDRLRKTNIDANLISCALKSKIWSKLSSKVKQSPPAY